MELLSQPFVPSLAHSTPGSTCLAHFMACAYLLADI